MKVAFLDLDGTLIDSSLRHAILLDDILKREHNGKSRVFLDYKANGFSTKDYLINILDMDSEIANKINDEWVRHIEDEIYLKYDKLYDDVFPFLEFLKTKNYLVYIVTARKNKNYIFQFLEKNGITSLVDEIQVVSPTDARREKKDYIEKKRSSYPIMIGDTEVDYYAAQKTGIRFFSLNRGFRNKKYWDKMGIRSYSDLFEISLELGKDGD